MESTQPEGQVEPGTTAEEKVNWGRFALDILETLFLAVVLFLGINAVSARVRVDGFSMRPTLEDGEFVLVNKPELTQSQIQIGYPGLPRGHKETQCLFNYQLVRATKE